MSELQYVSIRILGFDVGRARIGVARSTALGTAEPVETIRAKNRPMAEILARIEQLSQEHQTTEFVVGLPRNMDGSLGPQAKVSEHFAKRLHDAFPSIPIHLEDERLTTEAAVERLAAQKNRRQKTREMIDSMAAAIIVEAYLERRKSM